jgi:hypothetical protein
VDADRKAALNSPAGKERIASCGCGNLKAVIRGEPADVYMCSCQICQQKSGSAFTYAAIFPESEVAVSVEFRSWRRLGESGRWIEYSFCPTCGYTLFWRAEGLPGKTGIPAGCLSDKDFPKPKRAYWASRRHRWLEMPADIPHIDTQ